MRDLPTQLDARRDAEVNLSARSHTIIVEPFSSCVVARRGEDSCAEDEFKINGTEQFKRTRAVISL
ncbi:MAG: hypothetical protein NVSMB38_30530 [Ktedonobacteraceae bacterium]